MQRVTISEPLEDSSAHHFPSSSSVRQLPSVPPPTVPSGNKYISHILSNGYCPFEHTRFYQVYPVVHQTHGQHHSDYNVVYPHPNPFTGVFYPPAFSSSLSSSALNNYYVDPPFCPMPSSSGRKSATAAALRSSSSSSNVIMHDATNGNEQFRSTEQYFYDMKTTTYNSSQKYPCDPTYVVMSEKMSTELRSSLTSLKENLCKISQHWTSPLMARKNVSTDAKQLSADLANAKAYSLRRTVSEKFIRPLRYYEQPSMLSVFDSAGCYADDDVDLVRAFNQKFVRSFSTDGRQWWYFFVQASGFTRILHNLKSATIAYSDKYFFHISCTILFLRYRLASYVFDARLFFARICSF